MNLTARQRQITALVAQGLPSREIAQCLGYTVGSVHTILHRIYTRVGVHNRTALAIKVITTG